MSDWPRPSFVSGSSPKSEEERAEFLRLLRDCLSRMRTDGIKEDGSLHEEAAGFDRRYRASMAQIIQQCIAEGTADEVMRTSAEILTVCMEPLVERLGKKSAARSDSEALLEELYARTVFGVLSAVVHPRANVKLVTDSVELNQGLFAKYLNAMRHICVRGEECHCADRTPMEALIETTALIAAGKTCPQIFSHYLYLLYPHYREVASPKWALALNLLYPKHNAELISNEYLRSLLRAVEGLLEAKNITHISTIILSPDQASGSIIKSEPSDFLMITLELCLQAQQNQREFSREEADLFAKLLVQDPLNLFLATLELVHALAEESIWKDLLEFGSLYAHAVRISAPNISFVKLTEVAIIQSDVQSNSLLLKPCIEFLISGSGEERKFAVLEAWDSLAEAKRRQLLPLQSDLKNVGDRHPELREAIVAILLKLNKENIRATSATAKSPPPTQQNRRNSSSTCILI